MYYEMTMYDVMTRNDLLLMAMIVCVFLGLSMSIIRMNQELKELRGGKSGKKNK